MDSKIIKKHYVEKVSASRFQIVENLIKLMKTRFSKMQKRVAKPHYKTLLEFIISGPFPEKGLQNHQKALPREGFRIAFSKCRKHYKPMEGEDFWTPKPQKVTKWGPPGFYILHSSFFIFTRKHWRHIVLSTPKITKLINARK